MFYFIILNLQFTYWIVFYIAIASCDFQIFLPIINIFLEKNVRWVKKKNQ